MIEKQFKNLEEQIEIMKYKGLTIDDPDFAKKVLLRENYFFLNGYRYPLMKSMKDKRFLEGATFEEILGQRQALYERNNIEALLKKNPNL